MRDGLIEKGSVEDGNDAATPVMIQTRIRRPEITAGGAGIRRTFHGDDEVCLRRRDAPQSVSSQCAVSSRRRRHEDPLQPRPQGGQQCEQQQ